jgi:hypothetical protein
MEAVAVRSPCFTTGAALPSHTKPADVVNRAAQDETTFLLENELPARSVTVMDTV